MRKYKICVLRGDNCFSRAADGMQNTKLYGNQSGRVATCLTGTDVNISSSVAGRIQRVLLSPASTETGPSDIQSDLKLLTLFLEGGTWIIYLMNFVHHLMFKITTNKAQIFDRRIGPRFQLHYKVRRGQLRATGDALVRYASNYELDKSSPVS